MNEFLLYAILFGLLADVLTTLAGLSRGLTELNPVLRRVFDWTRSKLDPRYHSSVPLAVLVVTHGLFAVWAMLAADGWPWWVRVVIVLGLAAIVVSNCRQIWRTYK